MNDASKWIYRWKHWIAPTPVKEGVWRRKEGGFLVRGRALNPRTGQLQEVRCAVHDLDAAGAYSYLQAQLLRIREGANEAKQSRQRFSDFSVSLLERKIATNELKSVKSQEKWGYILKHHLLPPFGAFYLDELKRSDFELWRVRIAKRIAAGEYKPTTANDWLSVLRVIMGAAVLELELDKNPVAGLKDFDTSEHETYTDEEPNSLTVDEVPLFLAMMRESYPQHFAMVALGFATGLRPSSLRPIRRKGETPDVLWKEGAVLIRQSHTRRQVIMRTTKTKRHQRLSLPNDLMDILRWHVAELPDGPMQESDLLFPSETGGYRSSSCLDKPFQAVSVALELSKHITPRAMRRTFQDLARAAEIKDVVTRAVSGHATESMQRHYSTVNGEEMRQGLAKVISLAGMREAMTGGGVSGGGVAEKKKADCDDLANRPNSLDLRGAGDGT